MYYGWCIVVDVLLLMYCCWCIVVDVLLLIYFYCVFLLMYYCWCIVVDLLLLRYCCWCIVVDVLLLMYCCWCIVVDVLFLMYCCWCIIVDVFLWINCWCILQPSLKSVWDGGPEIQRTHPSGLHMSQNDMSSSFFSDMDCLWDIRHVHVTMYMSDVSRHQICLMS